MNKSELLARSDKIDGLDHWVVLDSADEFLSTLEEIKSGDNKAGHDESANPPSRWSGNVSCAEAETLLREGWPEGLAYVAEVEAKSSSMAIGAVPARAYGAIGYRPSVPRFLSGNPAHMIGRGEDITGGAPIIRMYVNCAASGAVDADALRRRGFAIMSAIDALETLGFRVELTTGWGTDAKKKWACSIPVKRAQEPLDKNRLVFMLAHPAFLRRIMFKMLEQFSDTINGVYGMPMDLPEKEREQYTVYFGKLLGVEDTDIRAQMRNSLEQVLDAETVDDILDGLNTIYGS